ncbi:MAG: tetratricopeptide repeat protein [Planctomycetia bacterium]|nr:tetratricopeptide repeat protein [Planctomycetia bacterium]
MAGGDDGMRGAASRIPCRLVLLVWAACLTCPGCGRSIAPVPPPSTGVVASARADGETVRDQAPAVSAAVRERLLEGAMNVLARLDDYDEESAAAQVFDRLNQWSHGGTPGERAGGDWRVDPLFERLPERLRGIVPPAALSGLVFDASADVSFLRDQRWLADIAANARGGAVDDVDVAVNLFRWTVRSLAITSDPPLVPSAATPGTRWFRPGEILLSGRASAAQRSWIFLELLRHSGLDGVMLATGDAADGSLRGWVPALISGGEAHLFEPSYGLPIPGPDGAGVATARQAASDPSILGRLSSADRPYPVQSADVARLSVLVAADPWTLSRRMRLLGDHLAGVRSLDLSVDATGLGERAGRCLPGEVGPDRVRLWDFPWESFARRGAAAGAVARELAVMNIAFEQSSGGGQAQGRTVRIVRPLRAARLKEFRGDYEGPEGAKMSYLSARPGTAAIAEAVRRAPPDRAETLGRLYEQMKQDATYWLGVLTLAEGDFETAVDYLDRMTLQAAPDCRWADAARTNLAEALIGLGRTKEAAGLLREDQSPQRFGSRLLADQLEKKDR